MSLWDFMGAVAFLAFSVVAILALLFATVVRLMDRHEPDDYED